MLRKIRINLTLAWAMVRDLDRLMEQEGCMDRTDTIRYCIRLTCETKLRASEQTQRKPEKQGN
jgi:metal-responsive CopG/Arc/MetJ family transcriptional regulator